jgi:hypothetical protein
MPLLKGILGKEEEEEFVEINETPAEIAATIPIKIESVSDYSDADKVQRALREGHIVLAKVKGLREKDMTELKRVIERIKRTCIAVNGEIVGLDQEWVLVTPAGARVVRPAE